MAESRKPNRMGATFAERLAARNGDTSFTPVDLPITDNTTFAERAGKPSKKAVKDDDEQVEDKAVKSAESKAPAKKSAAKKS